MSRLVMRVALGLAAGAVLASCSGGSGAAPDEAPKVLAATTDATTTSAAPAAGDLVVRVVADSEVPDPVSELLDQQPGIAVASMHSEQGATMAELDPTADEALAAQPDVLVYAGGTNDMPAGPIEMVEHLTARLEGYVQQTCVVVAVPVFRYERGTDAEVAQRTAGTRTLEQAVGATGAKVASYLDISLAMDDAGQDFFAEGPLGDLHPDVDSYPAIAESIADQVRACADPG